MTLGTGAAPCGLGRLQVTMSDPNVFEHLHRAQWQLARQRIIDWLTLAVRREVIEGAQARALLVLWDETHPYVTLEDGGGRELPLGGYG